MFEKIYRCSRTIARHENGPLCGSRVRYLEHLASEGAAITTLRAAAGVIYRAAIWMRLDETSPVERTEIERVAKEFANRPYRLSSCRGPQNAEKEFRWVTSNWMRFAGRLQESDRVPVPRRREVEAYCQYLLNERDLSPTTVGTARHDLGKFFKRVGQRPLKRISINTVDRFLAWLGEQGWTRAGIQGMAYHLRGFFRYGESQGWTAQGVAAAIRGPRVYRQERLPLGPSWPDVQRLLASTETDRKADIRDHAILILLAVYGLRVGEVRRLRLEDIDWERKTLTISRTKQRPHSQMCPLTASLADAIHRYLREVRPPAPYSELFLRLNAPHRPFRHGGLYGIVATRMQRLGIVSPRIGPHCLRHACATHLLAQGLTLTDVAGHLGHRSVESTQIYAKVDMAGLRAVANLDLGGLL
ncbi:MAG: tyrosine-type recombinase/integrase [Terriglobia bacterium]